MNLRRHLTAAALAAPLLAAGLTTAGTSSATAATPACHGQRATVVGHGDTVHGTPHRDVIVSNGARTVSAGAGDDLVCITGGHGAVDVRGGSGDDTVDNRDTNPASRVTFRSGTGSDRYSGGRGYDEVTVVPDGRDRIDTGRGGDYVTVAKSPSVGTPRIDLGPGNDILAANNGGVGGHLTGGSGRDTLAIKHHTSHAWVVDNSAGRARAGGDVRFRWSSFESFDLDFLRAPDLTFLGSDGSESLFLPNNEVSRLDLRTNGGDDDVEINALTGGDLDLGAGVDSVAFHSIEAGSTLTANLLARTATAQRAGSAHAWTLTGVENLSASDFAQADLVGDDGPNTLDGGFSEHSSADGRGGVDTCDATTTVNCEAE